MTAMTTGILWLCAACYDVKKRIVPNVLTLLMLAVMFVTRFLNNGMKGLIYGGSICVIVTGIMLPLFIKGLIGAGDVKMLAAVTAIIQPGLILEFWMTSFSTALLTALVLKCAQNSVIKEKGIPLAVPICIGYMLVMGGFMK